ncbi:hypothetical protein [Bradyrhizobium sp. S3.7.6]
MKRECGDCTLCCTVMPVKGIGKPANKRCSFQLDKGCSIYHDFPRKMPTECRVWNCRWLVNDGMSDQPRPDQSHLVVDVLPDFITAEDNETGAQQHIQVVQVWCDPAFPDAHRDPSFRRYLDRLGRREGIAALIRFNSSDAITIFPPSMTGGKWHEVGGNSTGRERSPAEIANFMRGGKVHVER